MEKILLDICKKQPNKIDEEFLSGISNKIYCYYESIDIGRHSYSELSTYIYRMNEEDYEYLTENLNLIYDYVKENKNRFPNIDISKNIFKLIDHIRLELNRTFKFEQEYISVITQKLSPVISKSLLKATNTVDDKIREVDIIIDKQRSKVENMQNNMISVLGIFAAIIVAFFGGLSFLGSVIGNIHNVHKYKLSFIVILILIGLFNIIFMLIYSIAKLTGKSISSGCIKKDICEKCDKKYFKHVYCLKNRYPICYFFNICGFGLLFIIFILYGIERIIL